MCPRHQSTILTDAQAREAFATVHPTDETGQKGVGFLLLSGTRNGELDARAVAFRRDSIVLVQLAGFQRSPDDLGLLVGVRVPIPERAAVDLVKPGIQSVSLAGGSEGVRPDLEVGLGVGRED